MRGDRLRMVVWGPQRDHQAIYDVLGQLTDVSSGTGLGGSLEADQEVDASTRKSIAQDRANHLVRRRIIMPPQHEALPVAISISSRKVVGSLASTSRYSI